METPLDFRPATSTLAMVVRNVRDDQLQDPTPCADMSVAALLDHIDGLSVAFTAAARKERPPGDGTPSADGSRLTEGWRDRIAAQLDDLGEAWRDPAAFEGVAMAGPVEMPADQVALVAIDEVTVHGWDLARATGQEYRPDPAAVEACLGWVSAFDGPTDGSLFGPPVDVPADAPALDRLLGGTGRDPAWTR